ncbi:hypothetical protein FSO04_33270 [Paraburkholderia madseniana]|uniref:Uncharacterized protein n=1 Tax=Paraburkholderia madseniana TaxID=2599607 RepID=A0A6N6W4N9_9BURK|nr:hypothetical protein [Paraburkholderia madseniana]KAE8755637.1 hypothetical protein FSO04_33270 [Paraburkholderia madseniana]
MTQGGYPPLLRHILEGKEYMPIIRSRDVEKHRAQWRALIRDLCSCPPKEPQIADSFHTQWHVSGHRIRELVADDELLMNMLWVWLPRYEGPHLVLYRGENRDRFRGGKIGTAWSDQRETAHMFASGLNNIGEGGVILNVVASSDAIIAGPSEHSANWLREREFTVDWRKLDKSKIEQIQFFVAHKQ